MGEALGSEQEKMSTALYSEPTPGCANPMEVIELVFSSNGWSFERLSEEEITAVVPGSWCEYHLRFFWREDGQILQMASVFDMKVPDAKRASIYEALALLNERLWVGHFETWADEGVLMYRNATVVEPGSLEVSAQLCMVMIQAAIDECERYYPVFQYVIWAGKSPAEAIDAALLETVGEA